MQKFIALNEMVFDEKHVLNYDWILAFTNRV